MAVSESTALRYQQSDPDVRLMMRVREDDSNAFTELMRKYQPGLIRWMQTLGPKKDMAEDLMQETFVRIWKARKRYEPGAKFSTWMFTIATNVARNANRSAGRRHEINESDSPRVSQSNTGEQVLTKMATEASGLMPARLAEGAERAEIVREAVTRLSERQRIALMLSRFENMSYAEIAETMGLTTKAVKSLLCRARVNLRELLQPYVDSGVLPKEIER